MEFDERLKMLLTVCKYLHLFWRYLSLKKWVKYANERTDDIIHSTRCCIKCLNRAILANLQKKPLKLGGLMVLHATHVWL